MGAWGVMTDTWRFLPQGAHFQVRSQNKKVTASLAAPFPMPKAVTSWSDGVPPGCIPQHFSPSSSMPVNAFSPGVTAPTSLGREQLLV